MYFKNDPIKRRKEKRKKKKKEEKEKEKKRRKKINNDPIETLNLFKITIYSNSLFYSVNFFLVKIIRCG